jgi:putative N6-adenine-specific DNA methylase/tRNA (guanine6-N2)-methyltransferase
MKFLLTTNPGIEDIVEKEVRENFKVEKVEKFLQGKVFVSFKKVNLKKLFELHSVYHIIKYVSQFEISSTTQKGLEEIYKMLKRIEIEEMKKVKTFRITSQRIGEHSFTSILVQKFAGQALVDKYDKKVDLKNFDLNVIVDVIGKKVFVGLQLTKESLHKRFERKFDHPAAIKAPLAYAMLRLANLKKKDVLLDPFCGGGTIPIEAALVWDGDIKILASDWNKKFLEGAKLNARIAGVERFIEFRVGDARELEKVYGKNSIDKIVTNPPYGIRIGDKRKVKNLYRSFLNSAWNVLNEKGKIVFITLRAGSFRILVQRSRKFLIEHERIVENGGLYPHIFVLKKI